jgi:hypothetical protein
MTVFASRTASRSKIARARAVAGVRRRSVRTRTLVSTATTPGLYLGPDCRFHLAESVGLAGIAEASDGILEPRWRERLGRPQQHSVSGVLDDEFRTRRHRWASRTDFGRITLPFRGQPGAFHIRWPCRFCEAAIPSTRTRLAADPKPADAIIKLAWRADLAQAIRVAPKAAVATSMTREGGERIV